MSIRVKTIVTVSLALLILLCVLYASTNNTLLMSYAGFERTRVYQDVTRVYRLYLAEIADMERIAGAWAVREDTRAFLRAQDDTYVRDILTAATFSELQVHCMVFLDPFGKVLYDVSFDLPRVLAESAPPPLLEGLQDRFGSRQPAGMAWADSGLVMLPEGPMLIAARPVPAENGLIAGTLLIGRRLDSPTLARLSEASRFPLAVRRYAVPQHGDFAEAKRRLTVLNPITTQPLGRERIAGYHLLTDLAGTPALLLRIETQRDIYRQGLETSRRVLLLFLLIGLACSLIIIRQLDRHVLSRLARLHRDVRQLRDHGDLAARITPLEGGDELTHLSLSVNEMLHAMEASQQEVQRQITLRESETRYRELVELSPDGVFILVEGQCAFANATGVHLLGATTVDEVLGLPLRESLLPVSDEPSALQAAILFGEEGMPRCEARLSRLDNAILHVEISATPCPFQGQPAMQLIAHDITERKRAEERVNYLAYFDALTDIPNRALFHDRLAQAMSRAERYKEHLAILVLDVDHFHEINTVFGHAFGDRILKSIAARLTAVIRQYDTVARASGDEFCCAIAGIADLTEVEMAIRRVSDALTQPFELDGQSLHITSSMGVSLFPGDGDEGEVLLQNANVALTRAKEQGNACVFFSQGMEVVVARKREVEEHLRRGLEQREFQVYYQPQVDLKSMRVVGVEALLRWNHPSWGLLTPDRFVPIAEETGLIDALDEWVLLTACEQAHAWHRAGHPDLRVACNLSARQFRRGGLADTVVRVLEHTGINPHRLELEITESVAMENVDGTLAVLHSLDSLGVRIAIDDFGTGYSSLSYLKKFPVHTLKIDQSFVRDVMHDQDDAAIVTAIIRLTHSLKLRALAEGVESEEQLAFLRERNCDEVQGYLLGRPAAADHIAAGYLTAEALPPR